MKVVSYENLALAWHPKNRHEKSFILLALTILTIFLGVGIFISSIDVPKQPRKTKIEIPERVAKFILDKPKPKPKPKPKKIEKPKPKPKPKVKRKKPEKQIKLTKKQKVARKKAEESGLLALSEELSDLVDTSTIDSMVGKKVTKSKKATQVATVDTDRLSSDATQGSGGVKAGEHLSQADGKTKLDTQQREIARQLLTSRAGSDSAKSKKSTGESARIGNYRSEEDIAYVMDRNKSKLHSIYRRARRNNPGIKGKIVLVITILPSGKVESVKIKSSELNDTKLESRIIARIKQFNFGIKNVKKVTVTYPVEFLPS